MNIFYISHDQGTGFSASKTWYNNLYLSFVKLGHNVIRFSKTLDEEYSKPEFDKVKLSEEIYYEVKNTNNSIKIDFCFFYVNKDQIEIEIIKNIRGKLGIKIINYSCNNVHQFFLVKDIAPFFDLNVYTEKQVKIKFDKVGANSIHIQMAANPEIYKPINFSQLYDVTFVGQRYASRADYITGLIKNNVDVKVWGLGWKGNENIGLNYFRSNKNVFSKLKFLKTPGFAIKKIYKKLFIEDEQTKLLSTITQGPIDDSQMIKLYSESKINLSFSQVENKETGKVERHVRLRDFEIPMCGGFYLTEYCEELEDYYNIGKEIEFFKNKKELLDKINFYLANESTRTKIAMAGYKRAINEHTWSKRLNNFIQYLDNRQ